MAITITFVNQTKYPITAKIVGTSLTKTVPSLNSATWEVADKYSSNGMTLSCSSSDVRANGESLSGTWGVRNRTITFTINTPTPTYYDYSCDYKHNGGTGGAQD